MNDRTRAMIVNTLRRCKGQYARPATVSREDEQFAIAGGYLRFNEWPSGHYQITDAGREFLANQ